MAKLSDEEITEHLEELHGWQLKDGALSKTYRLASFPAAIAFVTQAGFLAEAAAHHPDIDIRYNKVTFGLVTHDVGGLSVKDFELAAKIDELI